MRDGGALGAAMPDKTACPTCGDLNYPSDPVCLSCGADLRVSAEETGPEVETPASAETSPADWDIAASDPGQAERAARARQLALQAESLIAQGYHKLPKEPDARYGPADDVSDLCREIGECHMKNGDYEDATSWLGRALVVSPGNLFARAYLVGCLCRLGRYDEARAWYEDTPGDPIDKNAVRAWLDLPYETANVRDPRRSGPFEPSLVATERLLPSRQRMLPLVPEPRSA